MTAVAGPRTLSFEASLSPEDYDDDDDEELRISGRAGTNKFSLHSPGATSGSLNRKNSFLRRMASLTCGKSFLAAPLVPEVTPKPQTSTFGPASNSSESACRTSLELPSSSPRRRASMIREQAEA